MVSMTTKSYNQFKFLVSLGNKQNFIQIVFDGNKEGRYKDIGFWKIIYIYVILNFRVDVVGANQYCLNIFIMSK